MRDILVLMHDDIGQEARFQAALDVTRALGGHLTCLDVVLVPPLVGDFFDNGFGATLLATQRTIEANNSEQYQARLCREDVLWDWIDAIGDYAPCLRNAADLTDLIVVNRKLDGEWAPDMAGVAGDILMRSGTPLLAVPGDVRRLDASGKVLVAWDGSPSAGAALRAAVPLLRLALQVEIVEIIDRGADGTAGDAAIYLSRHGIHPTIRHETAGGRSAGTLLESLAGEGGYAYVVMGGFGHGRFKESVLGGVTQRMLSHSRVPLFMAH